MPVTGTRRRRKIVQSIPARIMALRQSAGWSQSELADKLEWNVMRVSRLEKGKTRALAEDVEALSAVFGVSISSFYGERT